MAASIASQGTQMQYVSSAKKELLLHSLLIYIGIYGTLIFTIVHDHYPLN